MNQLAIPVGVLHVWLARLVLQSLPWLEPLQGLTREYRDGTHMAVAHFMEMTNEH